MVSSDSEAVWVWDWTVRSENRSSSRGCWEVGRDTGGGGGGGSGGGELVWGSGGEEARSEGEKSTMPSKREPEADSSSVDAIVAGGELELTVKEKKIYDHLLATNPCMHGHFSLE